MAKKIKNAQQNLQVVINPQTIVNMAVVMDGAKKVEADIAKVTSRAETLKKSLEGTGLGGLDLSGVLKGGGLMAPFVAGVKAAIVEEDRLAEACRGVEGPKLGETTQNLKRLSETVEIVSSIFGEALLPVVNGAATALVPMINHVAEFVAANPNLVQGLMAGVTAFIALRAAVTGVMAAMALLSSPIGLIVLGVAAAAGLIVAYWEPISTFFRSFWPDIERAISPFIPSMTRLFSWTPLTQIIANWGAISSYFSQHLDSIKQLFSFAWEAIKASLSWTPLGFVIANWQPLVTLFDAIWGLIRALALPVFDVLKGMFEFSPLGLVINNWEPITKWFTGWWQDLQEIMKPIHDLFGGEGFIGKVTGKVETWTGEQERRNAAKDLPSVAGEHSPVLQLGRFNSANTLIQQTAATNRTQLEGGLLLRFDNAPQGLRVDQIKTNQPGLNVTSSVGIRTLSLGEAHGQ